MLAVQVVSLLKSLQKVKNFIFLVFLKGRLCTCLLCVCFLLFHSVRISLLDGGVPHIDAINMHILPLHLLAQALHPKHGTVSTPSRVAVRIVPSVSLVASEISSANATCNTHSSIFLSEKRLQFRSGTFYGDNIPPHFSKTRMQTLPFPVMFMTSLLAVCASDSLG